MKFLNLRLLKARTNKPGRIAENDNLCKRSFEWVTRLSEMPCSASVPDTLYFLWNKRDLRSAAIIRLPYLLYLFFFFIFRNKAVLFYIYWTPKDKNQMRFGQWNGTDLNRISQTRLQTNDFIYIKASAPLHFKEFYTNTIQLNSQFVNYVLCSSQKYYTFNVLIVKDLMTRAWKIRPVFRRRKLRNGKSYLDQYLLWLPDCIKDHEIQLKLHCKLAYKKTTLWSFTLNGVQATD